MKWGHFVRWRNYQDVLMAVYWLAEPDGMRCYASLSELAAETGLTTRSVRKHVSRLKERRIVMEAMYPDHPPRRTLVLLDHPEAIGYLERNAEYWGPLSRQREYNRERERTQG